MHSLETQDQFVELRAAGQSFGQIAEQLAVAKSTLHAWEDERANDIARFRRIRWEESEAHFRVRLEDQLEGLACDLLDYERHLSRCDLKALSVRESLMLLRETRRAYFQTRALLMGAPAPRRAARTPSPASQESNKTERSAENADPRPRAINDLQQSKPESFDSDTSLCPPISASPSATETHGCRVLHNGTQALPSPGGEGQG